MTNKTTKEEMEEVMYGLIMEKVWDAEGEVILDDDL